MKLCYVTDIDGKVLRHGTCSEDTFDLQANGNEIVHEGEPVLDALPPLFDTSYGGSRLREYPSIGDQLDMLWHSMNLNQIEKIEPFYSTIKAVKDKYPKT